jgi:NAD(P)-dependent dehydrogenase (short-subunit alcohol dehydrogenase family)
VKQALVTGAGRGIGRVIAERIATGYRVTLVARSEDELEATASAIAARGGDAVPVVADVTSPGDVEEALASSEPLDLLVNNAGSLAAVGPPWEVDAGAWWTDVETSLRGTYLWTRGALPAMLQRGSGTIVNLSSGSALRAEPFTSGYRAAKAAVATFTEDVAAAVTARGVGVFAVAPGFVDTAMTERLLSAEGRRWKPEAATATRVDPQLTAELVVRLASGEADRLSGRFLHALDDLDELLARVAEIERDDLYVLRLRRLSR